MNLLDWFPILGGTSVIALIILAILAPSVLQVAAAWLTALTPLLKGVAEAIVEFFKALWTGFLDMADNAKSILFVLVLMFASFVWGYTSNETQKCPECSKCSMVLPERKPSAKTPNKTGSDWLKDIWNSLQ